MTKTKSLEEKLNGLNEGDVIEIIFNKGPFNSSTSHVYWYVYQIDKKNIQVANAKFHHEDGSYGWQGKIIPLENINKIIKYKPQK